MKKTTWAVALVAGMIFLGRPAISGDAVKTVTATRGDTWASLAKKHLGDTDAAAELAAFNGKKPNEGPDAGQGVRIPGPERQAAREMIQKATAALTQAARAGVDAARLDEIRKGLLDANKALVAAQYNKARALARTAGGDADEARAAIEQPRRISFTVAVDDQTGTQFTVDRGTVEVKASGQKTIVKTGEAVKVEHGEAPVKVEPLQAPKVLEPKHGVVIYDPVDLKWSPVEGATNFSVDVAVDPSFHRRVMVGRTDKTEFPLPETLENGTYWWRVKAVRNDGSLGLASAPRRFDFAAGETKPKVDIGAPVWGNK